MRSQDGSTLPPEAMARLDVMLGRRDAARGRRGKGSNKGSPLVAKTDTGSNKGSNKGNSPKRRSQ